MSSQRQNAISPPARRSTAKAVIPCTASSCQRRNRSHSAAFRSVTKALVRQRILRDKVRIDGRGLSDIRTLSAEVEVLPRVHGSALAELSAEKRDQVLTEIDNGTAQNLPQGRAFFNRARQLTLQGMFGDPYYGGNKNFAGWDLIRYPGPRPAVDADMQRMDKAPTPYHRSAWGPQYK